MKKLLAILLALSFIFCLAGCGDETQSSSDDKNSSSDLVSTETNPSSDTASTDTSSLDNSSTTSTNSVTPTSSTTPTSSKINVSATTSKTGGTGTVDPNNVKLEEEYVGKVYFVYDADNIYAPGICFYNDGGFGDGVYCLLLDAMFTSDPDDSIKNRTPVTYKGTKYYRCGSGMSPAYVNITNTEIVITQDATEIKAVLLSNGNLKITKSNDQTYPVDTELSISWNYLS